MTDRLSKLGDSQVQQAPELNEEVYVLPTSFAQQRLWFLDQFEPDSPFYNIPSGVRFKGKLNRQVLEDAVNEIIKRHETLRTTFEVVDDQPCQIIHDFQPRTFPLIDISDTADEQKEARMLTLARQEASTPFNLRRGPLLRVLFIRLDADDHVILITMHHIISDGWSMGVFVREITTLYDAFSKGRPSPLPPLTIQYGDFAEFQKKFITGDVLENQLNYWKKTLSGSLPILELPSDRPRPAVQTMVGAGIDLTIDEKIARPFKEMTRRAGATLFMSLLAAYQVLLHRYTGLDDIIIGSPIANRNRAEIEPLIGFFINTLVLRADLSGNPTFLQLLDQIKKRTLESYDNQDIPFERLVEVLHPQRDMSHSPLFQVMFILQNTPANVDVEFSDVRLESLSVDAGTSTFDLTLMVSEGAGDFSVSAEFNTDIFDQNTIFRFLKHYKNLLAELAENADLRIDDILFLTQNELIELKKNYVGPTRVLPKTCAFQLIEKRAAVNPSNIAVRAFGEELTFQQLDERANQVARYLRNKGVKLEDIVGLCLPRSLDLIVALLAIHKAGAAYLPLDPNYPQSRLDYMINDAKTELVITNSTVSAALPQYIERIDLDDEWPVISELARENLNVNISAENSAYVIYTSGSTGKPKGVVISHRSMLNHNLDAIQNFNLEAADSVLQFFSINFDGAIEEIFPTLIVGGSLVLAFEHAPGIEEFLNLVEKNSVSVVDLPTAYWHQWMAEQDVSRLRVPDSLRLVILGGEDVAWDYFQNWSVLVRGRNLRLVNSYGPTETTIISTLYEPNSGGNAVQMSIGRPLSNISAYILDANLSPVPQGVLGELFIGGAGVARGYKDKPDLTADRFIPDLFTKNPGARMYRTGDLVRLLPDGNIKFVGRADQQVKFRGFRIELEEIESVIRNADHIRDCIVSIKHDAAGNPRLIAYLLPSNSVEYSAAAIRELVKTRLPDYMVPSAVMTLDQFPLLPNGKIDRNGLPDPDQASFNTRVEYVAPSTETEKILDGIWSKILGIEQIGIYDNFFELGGHSLLATQVLSRIRQAFHVELPLRNLFEYVTVHDLAAAVDLAAGTAHGEIPSIARVPEGAEPVLSFAQERLWFLDQLEPNSPFYNIPDAMRIKGALDVPRLVECVREVVRRHDVLRTTFHQVEGRPLLRIAKSLEIDCPIDDLRDLAKNEREAVVERLAGEEARRPFDLTQAPLLRLRLLQLDDNEYILFNTCHHIISDGWSSNVMIGEIAMLYDAFAHGQSSPLPALPLQYQDFAFWQRNWLKGEVLEREIEFWKKTLTGAPAVLSLPTDRPRPALQTPNGDFLAFELSSELTDALNVLSREQGVTLFMTLLSAFYLLLHRYSGQDDITIGTPAANRTRGELEGLVGFFVNTLVLRGDLSGNPAFTELLQRVKQAALGAFTHQDVPFEKIVDALHVERNLSHSPLFQVMFSLQNTPDQHIETETRLNITPVTAHSGTSKFDLTVFMVEEGQTLSGGFEYNTDLFDEATIRRLMRHFTILLREIAGNPQRRISALPMIPVKERQRLLHDWNGIISPQIVSDDVATLFESVALTMLLICPMKIGVRCGLEKMTYKELNRRANLLAHHLISLGVGSDTLVGLSIKRSIDMVVGMLGILKAGGAYVPLDPAYPQERLSFMLEDSQISVLITSSDLLEKLPHTEATIVCVDRDWPVIAKQPETNPQVVRDPDSLAYMIYTSGSTGRPKGTMITHRGLSNYLDWVYKSYPLKDGHGSIVHSTIAFDATVTALFAPMLAAKTITLLPDDADLEALAAVLKKKKDFTVVKITPAHLEMLSHQIRPEEAAGLTSCFVIGGENLTAEQIEFWQKNAPDTLLFNEYGPTETVVGCVVYEAHDWRGTGSVPIGACITNMVVYVLDENLELSPVGVPGELYIGGEGVARGYFNRPDLTAKRFIPDPFSTEPGRRLYSTGDLVRYMNDGNLIFLGRIDNQVKIRGYRIELGEIDAVLASHDRVKAVVTLAREDVPGDKRLFSYYVAESDDAVLQDELNSLLRKNLPDYMVPAVLVRLDEFPLTANGKVDRRALPLPEYGTLSSGEYTPPRSAQEELLTGIWKELLHLDRVGVFDNFFELGGHSLLATQMMSRIRTTFVIELPLRALFEAPTIAALVRRIDIERQQQEGLAVPPLTPVPRDGELPLSFAQQRLWFLDQLSPDNPFYNIPMSLKIAGELNIPAMEQSINEIVRRHEALRTIFANERGTPSQVIHAHHHIDLPITDLSALPPDDAEQEMRRMITQDAMTPFKLDEGPLFRAGLIRLAENAHVFLFTTHHIISDGWSTGVLMKEFGALYEAYGQHRPSPLPELAVQYVDYAAWQRSWLNNTVLARQIDFWKKQLGVRPPVLDLPLDYPRPPQQSFRGDAVSVQLSAELVEKINYLGQKHDATQFMTLLAAFQAFLYRYTHQDEIIVGSPIANRTYAETEALIGFFVNTLVLRAEFSKNLTFAELLAQIREFTLEAYAHQDIPFEQLVDELEPTRDMSRSPLFQVMFVLQNTMRSAKTSLGQALALEVVEPDERSAKFDLTLVMAESADGFFAELEYNTDLFARSTIERMLLHFEQLLHQVTVHPHDKISALQFVESAEKELLLKTWNQTAVDFPNSLCLHQVFEEQVVRAPDAPALFYNGEILTYAQLNERANQLAHYLRQLGVKPEQIVGICLERSLEMVISLLAVLKSGGAYLPIDPSYPSERIDYILKNSGASILLTDGSLARSFDGIVALAIDQVAEQLSMMSAENPSEVTTPENLAYVIYTSGSTGQPKGTMLQHRGAVNMAFELARIFNVNAHSRKLQFASFSFDASVEEIFIALGAGATLYLAKKQEIMPGSDLIHFINVQQITNITLPPSALAVMPHDGLPSLHTVVTAGEACPKNIAEKWSKNRVLVNGYGPTEATVCAAAFRVESLPQASHIPIGKPIGNARIYILDDFLEPVPVGVPGELCIAGVGLARGYLGRPDLTALKFIPNPFENGRLYRTGDLVRYLPDGNIEFLGRIDHQVKLRGFRIELGEIEQVLMRHAAVRQAVVLVQDVQGRNGDSHLTAYIVINPEISVADDELRNLTRSFLPEYMTPQVFVRLDAVPLTPNGKVDRRMLPLPNTDDFISKTKFVEPETELQKKIANIWANLLKIERVGLEDDFFLVGGHSLLAVEMLAHLYETIGQKINLANFFSQPTIDYLAKLIEKNASDEDLIVKFGEETDKPALFFIHPSGGSVHWYTDLARTLSDRIMLYAIQSIDIVQGKSTFFTVEEMASTYIKYIKKTRQEGPFYIGSWSMGVSIAYEIARQMEDQGQEIGALVLLDQGSVYPGHTFNDDKKFVLDLFQGHIKIEKRRLHEMSYDQFLYHIYHKVIESKLVSFENSFNEFKLNIEILKNHTEAWIQYKPEHFSGRASLIRSSKNEHKGDKRIDLGWRELINGELQIYTVRGDHHSILNEPNVNKLAEIIKLLIVKK